MPTEGDGSLTESISMSPIHLRRAGMASRTAPSAASTQRASRMHSRNQRGSEKTTGLAYL